jgi:DeoR/GlpR family transcriptional regulator of sugar metabolism
MLAMTRRTKIMEIMLEHGSARVAELSQRFQVTDETIRRDLESLENSGQLKKTYGGAVLLNADSPERSFQTRSAEKTEEKKAIARIALQLIEPQDVIILDASTTALQIAKNLPQMELVVVTNAIEVALELANRAGVRVLCTGGILRARSLSFVGPLAEQALHQYNINKAFISCQGVTLKAGATDFNELEARVKSEMIKAAREPFLLVDNSKFGVTAFATIARIEDFRRIITDRRLSPEELDDLTAFDAQVSVAE